MLKLFNDNSIDINDLQEGFIPIANHLLAFIQYYCSINPTYSYDLVCTKRSWYSQKQITLISDDNKNGLSWYLYGYAISISVYEKVQDQILDDSSNTDYIKQSLNFNDGSAISFIEAAQSWFNDNLLNGNVVKIFGVYPNIKSNIGVSISDIEQKYLNDPYVIYWGGLFKGYSNFTHWEWHPGYLPNEIYKIRESFLNTAYDQYDLLTNISDISINVSPNYLTDELEIIEEDYISIWKLKCEINLKKEYNFFDAISWAKNNPYSLNQVIIYSKIIGDYNQYSLFNSLKLEIDTIEYSNNILSGSQLFTINEDDSGYVYISYYNEFQEKQTILSSITYVLPTDKMPTSDEFDQIVLSLDDSNDILNSTSTDVSANLINDEISNTANVYVDPKFEINEHGLIGDISVNTNKLIRSLDDAKNVINSSLVFEEMITPPNQKIHDIKKGIIDISKAIKNTNSKNNNSDEMISPPV